MPKHRQDGSNVFLPDAFDRYEYFIQRLRLILSSKTHFFEVSEMVDLPTNCDRDQFPCIEVKIRLRGMWLKHPITGKPILSEARIKDCVEGWPMQELFIQRFANYLADTIPAGSSAENLRSQFKTLREGRLGKLPPKADLHLMYRLAVDHHFLEKVTKYFWWSYVERGDLTLGMIEDMTPRSMALQALMLRYDVEEEALSSRLYR
jgi:hypothetical protein